MSTQNKRILASILFVLISFVCVAQKTTPPPPDPAGGDNPVGLYIDGGIFFGVCLGLFYGVKKLLANK